MIATLPMYDWPEIRAETEALWSGIARHLGSAVPLSHPADYSGAWERPDLLFSQTCGYPFTHALQGKVKYLATPHYAADGCEGPAYSSMIFARGKMPLEAFRGSTAAVNTPDSMSGMLALKLVFAPYAEQGVFFRGATLSGGHRKSLAAVREGRADVCAVDAVCVELARRYAPQDLEGLVEIARSPLVPALPFITVAGDVADLRRALMAACADPSLDAVRKRLLIEDVSVMDPAVYDRITRLEREAELTGGVALLENRDPPGRSAHQ